MPITTPTVHLNGTARDDLVNLYAEAIAAVRLAESKLTAAAPNGRDYYPQGPDAINQAMREHAERAKKLHDVAQELEEIALTLAPF